MCFISISALDTARVRVSFTKWDCVRLLSAVVTTSCIDCNATHMLNKVFFGQRCSTEPATELLISQNNYLIQMWLITSTKSYHPGRKHNCRGKPCSWLRPGYDLDSPWPCTAHLQKLGCLKSTDHGKGERNPLPENTGYRFCAKIV